MKKQCPPPSPPSLRTLVVNKLIWRVYSKSTIKITRASTLVIVISLYCLLGVHLTHFSLYLIFIFAFLIFSLFCVLPSFKFIPWEGMPPGDWQRVILNSIRLLCNVFSIFQPVRSPSRPNPGRRKKNKLNFYYHELMRKKMCVCHVCRI